jgi:biotin transport system substrate-specific component
MVLYVLMGLLFPVYADGNSGLSVLTGVTGGYLVGFIVAGWAIGKLAEAGADRRPLIAFLAFVVGQLIVFGIGVPWLKVSADMSWATAIHDGFTIFIVGGIVKAIVAAALLPAAWALVRRVDHGPR